MRRERRPKKVHTTPAGPQTFMSSSARVAPQRPVRFHCIILSSVPASTESMKLCLIGRIFSIIAAASIYQSVHRFVYSCKNAYTPKKNSCQVCMTGLIWLCGPEITSFTSTNTVECVSDLPEVSDFLGGNCLQSDANHLAVWDWKSGRRCNPMAPTSVQILPLHVVGFISLTQPCSPEALQPHPTAYSRLTLRFQAINDVRTESM